MKHSHGNSGGHWVYLVFQSSARLRLMDRIEEEDLGRGGKLRGHGLSQKWCSCFALQQLKAQLFNKILLSTVTHSECGGRETVQTSITLSWKKPEGIFFSLFHLKKFSNNELLHFILSWDASSASFSAQGRF